MDKAAKNQLIVRTMSGLALMVIVLGAVLVSKYTFGILILAVCVGSMIEFYRLTEKLGALPQYNFGIFTAVVILVGNFLLSAGLLKIGIPLLFVLALSLFFIIFILELFRNKGREIINIGCTILGIIYVALPLSLLFHIAMFPSIEYFFNPDLPFVFNYKPYLILTYIFIVWANDIGAYLFGVTLGKHRLFERISPKKSWEGFFGGLAVAICGGMFAGWMMESHLPEGAYSMLFWGGLAIVAVVGGVFGDLVESMFKRSAGVKDSGKIMPGHGGFLDRFDALIFSAPFVFVYFLIFAT